MTSKKLLKKLAEDFRKVYKWVWTKKGPVLKQIILNKGGSNKVSE